MHLKIIPFLFSCLSAFCLQVSAQINPCAINTFQKTYGRTDITNLGMDIVEAPDHGFISVGWGANNSGVCFLMKVDNKGSLVWLKQVGTGCINGFMKKIIKLSNGNYVAMGRAYSPDYLNTWVIKFDDNGNIIWNKEVAYPTGIGNDSYNICELSDGGVAVSGSYAPYANAGGFLIFKLDVNGNYVWGKGSLNSQWLQGITERNSILYVAGKNSAGDGTIFKVRSSDGSYLGGNTIRVDNLPTTFRSIEEKNNKFYISGFNTSNQ